MPTFCMSHMFNYVRDVIIVQARIHKNMMFVNPLQYLKPSTLIVRLSHHLYPACLLSRALRDRPSPLLSAYLNFSAPHRY
jgi:hypothetical protein